MIKVKKEFLQVKPTGYRITLGDMNQNQLKGLSEKYPDYFETAKKKKRSGGKKQFVMNTKKAKVRS